ncbi:serine/threonine protein kinase [Mucilaginibacter psychrotolerans]|uniref:Serine/threonine protein kinase n=1 Tax=Mucilaginibacter psychrotolerans TaxID=1524096 RepID=A0A4Y8SLB3_9SPHI|nr:serine/threonine-protein kinase [Mucilaginibacter psychrotolerans]TFF39307.1 serine/threonine protein kinase [Mucilaginibacter psychrotolerans]
MSKVFTIAEGLENLGALRSGGQGSVYKGRRTGLIYSAVKLIPTPVYAENGDDKNYRNFQNEVAKLQKVNEIPNPNVVKILSFGIAESGSFPFIEMEYIDGPDLSELLQPPHEKIFMLKELLKVADQLACALAHCHTVGVKHGDIKSNNVKYNIHTGNYVLLDFGLAIMSEEQRRSSIRNAGAIEFMAPEQHEGKMLMQTDVYSYGIILYELLTGQVPFPLLGNGETGRNNVMVSHSEAPVPDAMKLRKANLPDAWNADRKAQEMQVPGWLLNIIDKCLQKSPESRYVDGNELHSAIISGSLATGGALNVIGPATLLNENEKLQTQLQERSDPDMVGILKIDGGVVHLQKSVFNGLVFMTVLFMGLFAWSVLSKSTPEKSYDPVAANATVKPYKSLLFVNSYNFDSLKKIRAAHLRDSVLKARAAIAVAKRKTDSTNIPQEKPKKKRKKFLGLF